MNDWSALLDAAFDDVCARAERALAGAPPGPSAQLAMAPRPRRPGWTPGVVPDDARPSAALALLYPGPRGDALIALTERAARLGRHAGQISLPGGALDDGESVTDAALREAHEEIGVDPRAVRVVGTLSPLHIPVSRFALNPVVAVTSTRPAFTIDAREVAALIEAPLSILADPANHGEETMNRPGGTLDVPYFSLPEAKVWGATAMVLAELLTTLTSRTTDEDG